MVTQLLFRDALLHRCARETEKYRLEKNMPFKISLIVDNASGLPPLTALYPHSKVEFLSPSITSSIQPADQGAIAVFQAEDLRWTFALATAAVEEEGR